MLNSITNAMHAAALITYTTLVYYYMQAGDERYTVWIFLTFLFVSILKFLGIIVHLPWVDLPNRERHNFVWILISIGLVFLNYATLRAIHIPMWALILGMLITVLFCGLYVHSLFVRTGTFFLIAIALASVYTLCAIFTQGLLQIAWICMILSHVLWLGLERVPWLEQRKLHNDIYHLALIASSFILYKSIAEGLWAAGPAW